MRECPSCLCCYDDTVTQCPTDGRATFHSLPGNVALEGKYVLERRLGEGGMGIVYKAHHKLLKTTRAIKIIRLDLAGNDPSVAKRFHQEAMAAAAIGHPNIISVPDFGFLEEKIPYIVMEFIEGMSLQTLMTNKGRFTPEEALEYMQVITSAVGAAHRYGIVHRDLKPLNIMIESFGSVRDQIRILDFGLAKIKSADLFGSFVGAQTTGIVGSPFYMAPEQWSEEETDKRCDVYSLGIILYQMLMGDLPFKGSSIPGIMKGHLLTPPPPLTVPGSSISPEIEKVVHRALEKSPQMRTPSVEEFIAELEQAVLRPVPAKATPVNVKEDFVDPIITQDLKVIGSPTPHVQIENDQHTFEPTLVLPLAHQSELLPKVSEAASHKADDSERVDAPYITSNTPLQPAPPQPLPGRIVIGQYSVVNTLFKKRFVVPIAAGVVLLVLLILFPFVYSRREEPQHPPFLPQTAEAASTSREMVLIEGGTFTMGSNSTGQEQKGEHQVTVSSFYIDKYEVTNAEYAEFIKDTGKAAPRIDPTLKDSYWEPWNGNNPPPGRERWPVTNISPKDVEEYAAWLSKRGGVTYRLPTEEEWEFAARNGSRDSLFPWGNSWEEGRANLNEKKSPEDVGSFPQGATQNGVQDMIGNVWEWTSSKPRFYDNSRVLSSVKNARVQRGGSFFEKINSEFHNATDRSWFGDENFKFPTIGFRLARDRE